jgi:hypothetical protein
MMLIKLTNKQGDSMSVILSILIIMILAWLSQQGIIKGKAQLDKIESLISQIERSPNASTPYDKFIEVWRVSRFIRPVSMFKTGAYNRILKICENNSSNIKAWKVLEDVVKKLNPSFQFSVNTGMLQRSNTFRLLADSLPKEFHNPEVSEKIIEIIKLLQAITPAETEELYKIALKILEANPDRQEAKVIVLDLGRLHYSILRPNKVPTIYDEQAIQNDIIVRSK